MDWETGRQREAAEEQKERVLEYPGWILEGFRPLILKKGASLN